MSLLENINSPADLRRLRPDQLQDVAEEIRQYILETMSRVGGHTGASLGAIELAVAMHYAFDTPRDRLVWDVGHQAYPHKILTGRRDQLATIRQYGGLAPFCSIAESEHDIMGAGHASTSVGYAVGIKEAMRHMRSLRARELGAAAAQQEPEGRVVAVIGDGAMT